ncbi:hypothetical protein [Spirosoma flavus]
MNNPFEILERRLTNIENLLLDLKHTPLTPPTTHTDTFGDFKWLTTTCAGVPASTLRLKSASGEIPSIKLGKRVLYDKNLVLNWLRSHIRQAVDMNKIDQAAELQFNQQLTKRQAKWNSIK